MKASTHTDKFIPSAYMLKAGMDKSQLIITGHKIGRPTKRITLNQRELKVHSAKVVWKSKNKTIEHVVSRINHLPTFEQVRIHTQDQQYPGEYQIELQFSGGKILKELDLDNLVGQPLRNYFPSFEDDSLKTEIKIEIN